MNFEGGSVTAVLCPEYGVTSEKIVPVKGIV